MGVFFFVSFVLSVFFFLPFNTKFKIDVVSHQHQLHALLVGAVTDIQHHGQSVPCFGYSFFQALHIHSRVLYRDEIILPGIVQVFRDFLQEIKYISFMVLPCCPIQYRAGLCDSSWKNI